MAPTVIALLGSPLPEGNAAQLLARAVQGARDAGCTVELIPVTSLDFQGCQEMFFCRDHETCILDDDMQQVYPKFREMDGLILATPVMTMGIPGTLKAFMDRFQVFFMAKYHRHQSLIPPDRKPARAGLFICISGMDIPEVFVGAKLTTRAFFDIIDCRYQDELLVNGMDTILDISTRPDLLDAAYRKGLALGKSLAASGEK
ncbi:flavodoxin family protein [Methanoregula sp.]|uniref:flavodoxin family protein n=1 Tax=Methanoregula sp. TaxID=2052170 RepID=UPI002B5D1A67|nr:flavodoxin family protein [Methanoregula sp.]HVP96399.1 flavodoxin family protein [Methanoregula sp.]